MPRPPQDMKTGFSRGFGYVQMSRPDEVDVILKTSRHEIDKLEVHTYTRDYI